MTANTPPIITLDAYGLIPSVRHRLIFDLLALLPVGHGLKLRNDHDPLPVRYQLDAEQPGCFAYHERTPEDGWWVAEITRIQ